MPAIIDATKAGVNSNSYVTLEEMDAYFDNYIFFDDWSYLTTDDKKRFILTTTQILEGLAPKFEKSTIEQSLQFPVSTELSKDDGWDTIVKATKAQIRYLVFYHEALRDAQNSQISGITSEGTSGYSKSFGGFNIYNSYSSEVKSKLSYYVDFNIYLRRG